MISASAATRAGLLEREAQRRVRAHRGARQHGALEPARVEHRREVGGQALVAVVAVRRRARSAPWPRAS